MKIVFAGDLLLRSYTEYIGDEAVDKIFEDVKPVFDSADFRMLNLETVYNREFQPIIKSGPAIFSMPEYVYALKSLKIDVAGLANNHTGDFGDEGVFYTMQILNENGVPFVGAGKNIEEAYKAHVFEKDGQTVSILAICENEFGIADVDKPGSAGFMLGTAARRIREEKEKSDYVVVFFHGGNEENPIPSPGKQDLYRFFIDTGADAVVCMHTHCPQGCEVYKNKPIIYSMGNFFYPKELPNPADIQTSPARFGYITGLTFENGNVNMELYPYHFTNEAMELLKGERLKKFNAYFEEICAPIHDPAELRKYFEGWCLIGGRIYVRHAKWDEEMRWDQMKIKNMRNALTCEAHYEVIREYVKLCYAGREEEAEPYKKKIEELTKIYVYEE